MMNKKYFKYLCISNKFAFLVLLFFGILFSLIPSLYEKLSNLTDIITILSIVCSFYFLSYIHFENEVNNYNSLPITKKELWNTRFLFSLIVVTIIVVITVLISLIFSYLYGDLIDVNLLEIVLLVFVSILLLTVLNFVIQSICAFVIESCNNLLDSCLSAVAYIVLPIYTMYTLQYFVGMVTRTVNNLFHYIPQLFLSPIGLPMKFILEYAKKIFYDYSTIRTSHLLLLAGSFVVWIGISLLLYKKTLKRIQYHDTELANKKSKAAWIKYLPVIWITVLFTMVLVSLNSSSNLLFYIFIIVLYFLGLSIYSRRLIFTKKALLVLVVILFGVNGFHFVFIKTQAFGLEERLILRRNFINVYLQQQIENSTEFESWQVVITDEELMKEIGLEVNKNLHLYYSNNQKDYSYSPSEINLLQIGYSEEPSTYLSIELNDDRYAEITDMLKEKGFEREITTFPR